MSSDHTTCHLRVLGRINHFDLDKLLKEINEVNTFDEHDDKSLNCPQWTYHDIKYGDHTKIGVDLPKLANDYGVTLCWITTAYGEGSTKAQFFQPSSQGKYCVEIPISDDCRELLVSVKREPRYQSQVAEFQKLIERGLMVGMVSVIENWNSEKVHRQPLLYWLESAACLWEQCVDPTYELEYHKDLEQLRENNGVAVTREFITSLTGACDELWGRMMDADLWDDIFDWEFCPRFLNWCVDFENMKLHTHYERIFMTAYKRDMRDLSREFMKDLIK